MYTSLFNNLTAQDTIITVNRRLASFLREAHAKHQLEKDLTVWNTPDILPFETWAQRYWQQSQLMGIGKSEVLLNSTQELILWQQIISQSDSGKKLLRVSATAQIAKKAWELSRQWQLDFPFPEIFQTEDTAAWQAWAETFQKLCKKNNWLDNATLTDKVITLVESKFQLPKRIFCVGFDELNPQYECLFSKLKKQNSDFIFLENIDAQINHVEKNEFLSCSDSEDELLTMARWAEQLYKNNSQTSIGCIIPNLTEIREEVVNVFSKVFSPDNIFPGSPDLNLPFNISSGKKLTHFALISSALLVLNLGDWISMETLSTLLYSPYLGAFKKESFKRAKLFAALCKNGEDKIHLRQLIAMAKEKNICITFAKKLENLVKQYSEIIHKKLLPSEWRKIFLQQLETMSWPGDRTLNSMEYQVCERWIKLLNEFSSLEVVSGIVSYSEAVHQLNELAEAAIFQAKTQKSTPIQVLGTLEASGLSFDHLWVMGLHDAVWPPPAIPNPFIPKELQREFKMPHASSDRELVFHQKITKRLSQTAAHVIFSYPQQDQDRILRPSPLINHFKEITLESLNLPLYQSISERIFHSRKIEFFEDFTAPRWTPEEKIFGGTSIFKNQAACPFRAFARIRLGAQDLELPQIGLTNREQGSLLHVALQFFWGYLHNQKKLLEFSDQEINQLIEKSTDEAITLAAKERPLTFKNQLTRIEKKRLDYLLRQFIEKEKNRPSFTVLAIEKTEEVNIADIPLKLRVDRIDELDDGSCLIIDYKTGESSVKSWFGERPDEPQLPLYCVTNELPVRGLLFAELQAHQVEFKGISENTSDIKNVKTLGELSLKNKDIPAAWKDMKMQWKIIFENLAEEFKKGFAKVDPKQGEKTCQYCDLQLLCRFKT
jgi:ATP-dependent helicase/nuclease subunit B